MEVNTMKTTIAVGVLALVLIGLVVAGGIVAAYQGDNAAKREEVANAIENNDYEGWKSAMQKGLTEENFNTMAERHAQSGERRQMMAENHELIKTAIESGDYMEWKSIIDEIKNVPGWTESITEDNFATLIELHESREHAKEISEELGIQPGKGKRGMMNIIYYLNQEINP
jgi:hypothetical protein